MFAIAVPTTINLDHPAETPDGKPVPFASITFRTADDDMSKCVMDVLTPEGYVHTVLFNTRGGILNQTLTPFAEPACVEPPAPVDVKIPSAPAPAGDEEDPIIPTGEIKQYPRDYNPNPTPSFVPEPALAASPASPEPDDPARTMIEPVGLQPEVQHG